MFIFEEYGAFKYLDRQACMNSVDPDKTPQNAVSNMSWTPY